MNQTRIVTIICWIITTVVLIGLVAWFITGPIVGFSNWDAFAGTFEERTTYSIPTDDIDAMNINWTAGRINVQRHHGNDIRVTEFSRRELRDGEEFRINVTNGTVSVEFGSERGSILRNTQTKRLEVLIPYEFDDFEEFTLKTISGRVNVNDLSASTLIDISTVSGRVEVYQIHSYTLNVSTTSGRIGVYHANVFSANLRTVSGRIEIADSNARDLEMRTTSGRQYISGGFEYIAARAVSGRIEVISESVPSDLYVTTTSGRISVTVPNEGPISVNYSLRSGRFSSDIPIIMHGIEDAQFRFSSTSGRISIYSLN